MDANDCYSVADISLADAGGLKVAWARSRMPALAALRAEAEDTQPLAGQRVAGCLHVTKETAVLIETLAAAGAEVVVFGQQKPRAGGRDFLSRHGGCVLCIEL